MGGRDDVSGPASSATTGTGSFVQYLVCSCSQEMRVVTDEFAERSEDGLKRWM
jgi:hypothetical protein